MQTPTQRNLGWGFFIDYARRKTKETRNRKS